MESISRKRFGVMMAKQFDMDDNGNLPRKKVIENIIETGSCLYNCWTCYYNVDGPRHPYKDVPEREKVCVIVDPDKKKGRVEMTGFNMDYMKSKLKEMK